MNKNEKEKMTEEATTGGTLSVKIDGKRSRGKLGVVQCVKDDRRYSETLGDNWVITDEGPTRIITA